MRPVAVSDEEQRWRRRSDARTLAEAEQIKADKDRYQGAIIGAKEIASEEIKQAESIAKVAGMKLPKVPKNNIPEPTPQRGVPTVQTQTQPFNKRGYSNPATIGRF